MENLRKDGLTLRGYLKERKEKKQASLHRKKSSIRETQFSVTSKANYVVGLCYVDALTRTYLYLHFTYKRHALASMISISFGR